MNVNESAREGPRIVHELQGMSGFIGLVNVRDLLLYRALQQGKYIGYVSAFLGLGVYTKRGAVIPPALRLGDQ